MNIIFKYLCIFILISNYIILNASTYSISGKIINKENNKPLSGVTVRIDKTSLGAYTNKYGEFTIDYVPNGDHILLISMLSFDKNIKHIKVKKNITRLVIGLVPKTITTNDIVVSANQRIQSVQDVPITIAVITSSDLKNKSINSLEKALEYVPGIQINRDNVSLRGSSGFTWGAGSRVALLLDGFPILSGDNGDMKFDALPLYSTERIEIIKGAGSALYGTSAIGGVINLITEDPKPELQIKSKIYSGYYTKPKYKDWEYSKKLHFDTGTELSISKLFDDVGVLFSFSALDEESYREYDTKKLYNGFSKINYRFNNKNKIDIVGSFSLSEADDWGWWNSLSKPFLPPDDVENVQVFADKYLLGTNYQFIFDENNFGSFRSSVYYTQFENNARPSSFRASDAININNELQLNSKINDYIFLTYGLNFLNNNIVSTMFRNNSQQIYSGYAQGEFALSDYINTNIGFRLDKEMASDSLESPLQFSPKFGISYFKDDFKLFSSIGRGFRAPMAAERFPSINYNGIKLISNTALIPETSWSIELGTNYEIQIDKNLFFIEFSLFQNHLNNLINPEFVGSNLQFVNVSQARIQGVELTLRTFLFGMIGLEGSLSAIDPIDLEPKDKVNYLKYRSKFLMNGKVFIPMKYIELVMDYKYVSRMMEIDDELGSSVSDADARVPSHIVDLRVIYDMEKHLKMPLKLILNGFNVFDYYRIEMVGNMGPTKNIRFQMEYIY